MTDMFKAHSGTLAGGIAVAALWMTEARIGVLAGGIVAAALWAYALTRKP